MALRSIVRPAALQATVVDDDIDIHDYAAVD
jgi:hypothetical protein